ncbi:hypothetical protein Efla_000259 [Eimeria flavescens]
MPAVKAMPCLSSLCTFRAVLIAHVTLESYAISTGARVAQGADWLSQKIHLGDLRAAERLMLEDILTVQESGVFNELFWACDGTAWDTVGCAALREAIFCLSRYYLIDRLNLQRGFSKANWIDRDGGSEGLLELASFCSPEVFIWQSEVTASCTDAMSHLSLPFPSAQRLNRMLSHSPPIGVSFIHLLASIAASMQMHGRLNVSALRRSAASLTSASCSRCLFNSKAAAEALSASVRMQTTRLPQLCIDWKAQACRHRSPEVAEPSCLEVAAVNVAHALHKQKHDEEGT